MATEISATEAARRFSDLLIRVRYAGESFVVVLNGEAVCRIEPVVPSKLATVADLLDVLASAPSGDDGFADDLEKTQRKQPKLPRSPWVS